MALVMRREWVIAAVLGCGLVTVLGWAWADGGERAVQPISQPITLQGAGR